MIARDEPIDKKQVLVKLQRPTNVHIHQDQQTQHILPQMDFF